MSTQQDIPPALAGVVVVLDRPQDLVNVAATVRAMGNFGLLRLRLVEPAAFNAWRIGGIAHRSGPILERVERFPSLDDALADCGFVLGTTARSRAVRQDRLTPRQAAPALLAVGREDRPAAVLLGPEDNGLTNEALGRCNAVITIPTSPHDASLNLAQAVLVIAYELWLAATAGGSASSSTSAPASGAIPASLAALGAGVAQDDLPPARVAEREALFAALEEVIWGIHPNNDAGRVGQTMARLRALLLRAAPRADEVQMLTRIFVHLARHQK